MPRSVLIVDDSRTALASLSRQLRAQGIVVDTVESGPEALDFLRSNPHPGVIFLDHMMPGMDGFETLSAIKRAATTASIPVVMYTTREGDAYMGQALALGAVGLLHKPVEPAELSAVLQRVDRLRNAAARAAPPGAGGTPRAAVTGVINVPEALRSATPQPETADRRTSVPAVRRHRRSPVWWWMAGATALVLVFYGLYSRYQQVDRQFRSAAAESAKLRDELSLLRERPSGASLDERPAPSRAMLDVLAWAINRHTQYGFNEEPMNDALLAMVRELVTRLTTAGFSGTVRLESHIAEFCLSRDTQGNLRLPSDGSPFLRCEVTTYPPVQAELRANRQSAAFAQYVTQSRTGPVRVEVVPMGAARPLVSYPDRAAVQTAGDWNQVARANQRVEVVLIPAL